jgi:hypothetical protein
MDKRNITKGETMIYEALNRRQKVEQNEPQ